MPASGDSTLDLGGGGRARSSYQPPPPPPPPPPPEDPPPPLPDEEPGAVEEEEMAPGRDVPRLEAKPAISNDRQVLPVYQVGR